MRILFNSGRLLRLLLLCCCPGLLLQAQESGDYDHIASESFWRQLYPGGGWTLYCGYKFDRSRMTASGWQIEIEHIFPSERLAVYAGCENRMQCRETKNARFMRMEADIHNMYPAWQTVITHRYGLRFGLVSGEDWRFDDCDFEWKQGIVEPRVIARGNIARTMLYMHAHYRIPIDANALSLFRVWNRVDPPSKQERMRNNIIERMQGNRNPFIDEPKLADTEKLLLNKPE